jgi:hypothetical protein
MDYSERSGSTVNRPGKAHASMAASVNDPDQFSRQLLAAMIEFRDGNFDVRLPADLTGLSGKLADTFNELVTLSDRRAHDVARVSRMVGREGKVKERLAVFGAGARAEEIAASTP